MLWKVITEIKFGTTAGCMFPEGFLDSNQTCVFNHDQIQKVYHLGLEDDEEKSFNEKLKELTKTL